ncbi:hypothetical protein PIROE2DRAFT_61409 [Piromyces sp. E2]|nr:hypothetical protein PIROE2DRAFT_61409 [Piromyces sp. E2]|eukprot:OUM63250.1 hypothetical protein PIROE2DRAFT_61409 [Piromyces sp. E2]
MVSDKKLQICNIFYGDKDKGVPVIGKFIRKNDNCEVKLSPNIDYVFMLGLASFFFCKDIYNNEDFNNGYDNIARIDMPLLYYVVVATVTIVVVVVVMMTKKKNNKTEPCLACCEEICDCFCDDDDDDCCINDFDDCCGDDCCGDGCECDGDCIIM